MPVKAVKTLSREIEQREAKLNLLLDADYDEISPEENEALVWLRDNAVSLLADYINLAGLVLDAYPLVAALHTMSENDAVMSKSAQQVALQSQLWLERLH